MVKPVKKPKVERRTRRKTTRFVSRRSAANSAELHANSEKMKRIAELRDDLFREAARIVAEDPSQRIAILIIPRNPESILPLQSFGHPSTESVVQQFLKDTAPPVPVAEDAKEEEDDDDDWSKYKWWEDEKLVNSKDPVEIKAALVEMEKLMKHLDVIMSETGEGSGTQDDDDGSKP